MELARTGQSFDSYGAMMHDTHQTHMMPPNVSMMPNQAMSTPYAQQQMIPNHNVPYQNSQAPPYSGNHAMRNAQGLAYQNAPVYPGNSAPMQGGGVMGAAAPPAPTSAMSVAALAGGHSSSVTSARGPTPATLNNDSNSNLSQADSLSGSDTPSTPGKQYPGAASPLPSYSAAPPAALSPGYGRPVSHTAPSMPQAQTDSYNQYPSRAQSAPFTDR